MKKRLLLLYMMILFSVPTLAMHDTTRPESEIVKERITETAAAQQELSPITLEVGPAQLTLSGLIEAEASLVDPENGDEEDDLKFSTVLLGLEAELTPWLQGHIIGLWEEDDTESAEIDEAVMVLSLPTPVYGQTLNVYGGRQYLPFGNFNSSMVSTPLTLDLGESRRTSVVMSTEGDVWSACFGVFNGKINEEDQGLDTYVARALLNTHEGVTLGVSYLSDLAEIGAELVQDETLYSHVVAGGSTFLSLQFGDFGFDAEWLQALDDFDRELVIIGEDLTGKRPSAWFVEGRWSTNDQLLFVLRHEQAQDYLADTRRTGATAAYGLCDYTQIAVEYLNEDNDVDDPVHLYTAQLAIEF